MVHAGLAGHRSGCCQELRSRDAHDRQREGQDGSLHRSKRHHGRRRNQVDRQAPPGHQVLRWFRLRRHERQDELLRPVGSRTTRVRPRQGAEPFAAGHRVDRPFRFVDRRPHRGIHRTCEVGRQGPLTSLGYQGKGGCRSRRGRPADAELHVGDAATQLPLPAVELRPYRTPVHQLTEEP